jgi:hypothetical protein
LPAVIFVVSDAIGQNTRFWTEDFLWAYLRGDIGPDEVESVYFSLNAGASRQTGDTLPLVWEIVQRGPQLARAIVETALARLRKPLRRDSEPAQMLGPEQIRRLTRHRIAIGVHGKTHVALPFADDLATELREPVLVLNEVLASEPRGLVRVFAFPHGAHSSDMVDRSLDEGYELVFTTREELVPLIAGRVSTPSIGRINVNGTAVAPAGRLRPELLAFHFFRLRHATSSERLQVLLKAGQSARSIGVQPS